MTQNIGFKFQPHYYALCHQRCVTATTSRTEPTGETQRLVICPQPTVLPVMYVKEQTLELPYK